MKPKMYKIIWATALCFAMCCFLPATVGADLKMTPTKSAILAEPPGLALAIKAVLGWWQQRAVAFPEFHASPPGAKWTKSDERYSNDPTYVAPAKDGYDNWSATTYRDRPKQWKIMMPTHVNCTVIYSVFADPATGETRVWEVRFSYRTVSLCFPLTSQGQKLDKGQK
jgi:hypothetical protein